MKKIFLLAFTCALMAACTSGNKQVVDEEDMAVDIPASIVYNFDSIYHYEMLAFKQNDPKGLFITASVAYLQAQGDSLPEGVYVVSLGEADTMLMIAADKGYQPAKDLIHCLYENDCWHHEY